MFKLVEDIHHCFISEESPNDPDFQNVYSTYAHNTPYPNMCIPYHNICIPYIWRK